MFKIYYIDGTINPTFLLALSVSLFRKILQFNFLHNKIDEEIFVKFFELLFITAFISRFDRNNG